jgi:hypothetical protein
MQSTSVAKKTCLAGTENRDLWAFDPSKQHPPSGRHECEHSQWHGPHGQMLRSAMVQMVRTFEMTIQNIGDKIPLTHTELYVPSLIMVHDMINILVIRVKYYSQRGLRAAFTDYAASLE